MELESARAVYGISRKTQKVMLQNVLSAHGWLTYGQHPMGASSSNCDKSSCTLYCSAASRRAHPPVDSILPQCFGFSVSFPTSFLGHCASRVSQFCLEGHLANYISVLATITLGLRLGGSWHNISPFDPASPNCPVPVPTRTTTRTTRREHHAASQPRTKLLRHCTILNTERTKIKCDKVTIGTKCLVRSVFHIFWRAV